MKLKLRFIFIISCWPGGPTPYRIRRCPDWGYLGADKFERGLSQVAGPTRIRPPNGYKVSVLGGRVLYNYCYFRGVQKIVCFVFCLQWQEEILKKKKPLTLNLFDNLAFTLHIK
jgi:hypothetical protein